MKKVYSVQFTVYSARFNAVNCELLTVNSRAKRG